MVYLLFFLSGCNFGLCICPMNKVRWFNITACLMCLLSGLITAGII